MFLAHFINVSYDQVLKWSIGKINYRFEEAQSLRKKMFPERYKNDEE